MSLYEKTFLVLLPTLMFGMLPCVFSQSEIICPCDADRNALVSQWGSWTSAPVCTGECGNNVLAGISNCLIYTNNRTAVVPYPCFRSQINGCDRCVGQWSEWGSIEECDAICGFGMQLESRSCYLRDTVVSIRSDRCAGDLGVFSQYRNSSCSRLNNCANEVKSSTTSPRTRTVIVSTTATRSTQSTTTEIHSTIPARASTTTSQVEKETFSMPSFKTPNETKNAPEDSSTFLPLPSNDNSSSSTLTPDPVPSTQEFDTVILAAVLGSVAIVCVTIVAVAFVIVTSKNSKHFKRTATYSTKGHGVINTVSRARGQEVNYERRGSGELQNKSFSILPEVLKPAANGIYETSFVEGGTTQSPSTTMGAQLQKSFPAKLQDSVYLSVEDN